MEILQDVKLSSPTSCPYLPGRTFTQEYFFAHGLSAEEFQEKLDGGWRRFGLFFFRPSCENCRECRPIRIPVESFKPSRSQKRNIQRNGDTKIFIKPNHYREEIFQLYLAHRRKFPEKEEESLESFKRSYFQPAVPTFQSEYYVGDQLGGIGFLDQGSMGLSTIYFSYHPSLSALGLGTFSILKEIEITRELGLKYYYLGYYIKECDRMHYKGRFRPFELMDWADYSWSSGSE